MPKARIRSAAKTSKAKVPSAKALKLVARPGLTRPGGEAKELERLRQSLAEREARVLMLESQADMLLAKLRVTREVAHTSASDFSLPEMLELFMDVALEATHSDAGGLLLMEEGGLRFTVVRGPKSAGLKDQLLPHNEGIAGWVARTGEAAITEDPRRDARHSARISKQVGYDAHNILAVPLKGRTGVLGVLQLLNRHDGLTYSHEDLADLESLALPIAMVLENARLFEGHQQEIQRLTSLIEASQVLNSTLDLKRLLKLVMELAARTLNAEASRILLVDKKSGELTFEVATGEKQDAVATVRVPVGEGIAGWVALNNRSLLVPDVNRDPRFFKKVDEKTRFVTRDILAVPVTVQGRLIGVAEVLNKRQGRFSVGDQQLLEALAHQSGIAIQNAGLYADLQESFWATLRCLDEAALEELKRNSGSQFDPQMVEAILAAYAKGAIKTEP
jgi:adenylate cyclase